MSETTEENSDQEIALRILGKLDRQEIVWLDFAFRCAQDGELFSVRHGYQESRGSLFRKEASKRLDSVTSKIKCLYCSCERAYWDDRGVMICERCFTPSGTLDYPGRDGRR